MTPDLSNLVSLFVYVAPAVAVYVGIRVDIATMKVRLDHLERLSNQPKKGA
jgi:hypothetical protein